MPYYPDTLRSVIKRGEADARTLLSYVEQIGEALQFVHEQGIAHRDIGPAADIYALGLIINECFTGETLAGPSYASIEASYPLMSYLDPLVTQMLSQSPDNRPAAADVLTDIRFFEAKTTDGVAGIEEALRSDGNAPQDGADRLEDSRRT